MSKRVIFLILFSTLLSAGETKTEKLSSDSTVQKSERKAVILHNSLGMSSYSYSLPVTYCPDSTGKKKPKCRNIGTWKGSFSKSELDSLFNRDIEQLVSKRYDIINLKGREATVSTATERVTKKLKRSLKLKFHTGSDTQFNSAVKSLINSKSIVGVIKAGEDARYSEMSSRDRDSFIRQKGKNSGIPAEVSKALMNSAFSFSIYYGKIEGSVTVSQVITEKKTYYSTSLEISKNLILTVYQFKDGNFIEYSTVSVEGGNSRSDKKESLLNLMNSSLGGSGTSVSTDNRPDESDSKEIIRKGLEKLFKEGLINLNTQLKEDRNFKIVAPVKGVDGNTLTIAMGIQEDIRVDHPFMVERMVNGEAKTVGFFKVRKSGKNCLSQSQQEESTATAIKGSIEAYDLALEHPWTGVFGSIEAGIDGTNFSTGDIELDGGSATFLNIKTKADLGYILNNPTLSEVWFGIGLSVGTHNDIDKTRFRDVSAISGTANLGLYFDIAKRIYIGNTGVYTDLGIDLGYRVYGYDYEDGTSTYNYETDTTSDGKTLSITYMETSPFAKIGWNWSPDVEFFGKVGYTVPFGTAYKLKDGDDNEYNIPAFDNDLTANGGLNFLWGVSIHTNFTGGFTKMFSKPPSSSCQVEEKR